MMSCITPHMGEEIWQILGHDTTLAYEPWPVYDESYLKEEEKEIAVQVNGKVRATIFVREEEDEKRIEEKALQEENVQRHIAGKEIVKVIVIKGKICNIVVKN